VCKQWEHPNGTRQPCMKQWNSMNERCLHLGHVHGATHSAGMCTARDSCMKGPALLSKAVAWSSCLSHEALWPQACTTCTSTSTALQHHLQQRAVLAALQRAQWRKCCSCSSTLRPRKMKALPPPDACKQVTQQLPAGEASWGSGASPQPTARRCQCAGLTPLVPTAAQCMGPHGVVPVHTTPGGPGRGEAPTPAGHACVPDQRVEGTPLLAHTQAPLCR
jgi:hypothetical protein